MNVCIRTLTQKKSKANAAKCYCLVNIDKGHLCIFHNNILHLSWDGEYMYIQG